MKTIWSATALILTLLLAPRGLSAALADTDPAAAQIQTFYDALLDSMKHGKELGVQGRYNRLKPAVEKAYDLQTMTKFVSGPGWSSFSPADQQALVTAFERMTIANYAKNFDSYGGEKFTVDPAVQARGADRIVMSKMIAGGEAIPFNYRMRQSGGTWKIIDVYLNGSISELATRRSDFGATVSAGGAPALIRKIDDLADRLMK
ncbi:MAG TPA: ABC transporter substrate-binding protein [Rhizomicrobium sp.]|jgi:phospholipid transport system substrate-binding protein|nr:ABC transporter substrate-binding protein [Rhizomicrobium sp.]